MFFPWSYWWKAASSPSCHWKHAQGLNLKLCFLSGRAFQGSMCFFFLLKCQTCYSICSMGCQTQPLWFQQFVAALFASILTLFVISHRILRSQWDVRALEAGLTEGAWWNTNPSKSMSASFVCHASLGSMVADGNAINAPMMTPPRWEAPY